MSFGRITLANSKIEIEVLKLITVKQHREGKEKVGNLMKVAKRIEAGEDSNELAEEILNKSDEQDEVIIETLINNTSIKREELEAVPYLDALLAYNKLFEMSTLVPKNSNKPVT